MKPQLATPAYARALAAIHASAFPASEVWGEYAIDLQLALSGSFGLIDQRGGMLLGRVTADEAEVLTLAVAPAAARAAGPVPGARYTNISSKPIVKLDLRLAVDFERLARGGGWRGIVAHQDRRPGPHRS